MNCPLTFLLNNSMYHPIKTIQFVINILLSSGPKLVCAIKTNNNKIMEVLGVEFAPISIPWERRLETISVLLWGLLFLFSTPITLWLLYSWLFYSNYLWPLTLIYFAWYIYDLDTCNRGGQR